MATTKSAKIEAEIEKVKAKIAEQQTKLKELEQRKVEAENSEIVDIVRGMSIPLAELPLVLQQLRAGKTLGQNGAVDKVVSENLQWEFEQKKRRPPASFHGPYQPLQVQRGR